MYNILVMLSLVEIYENTNGGSGAILENVELVDMTFLALSTLLLFIFYRYPKKNPKIIDKQEGYVLFAFYIAYIYWIY